MDFDSFVLAAATADLADEPAAREHADAIEFRMDLAEAPLDQLERYDGNLPLICTNRVEGEGGEAPATPARLDALATAARKPFVGAIDIELATIEAGEAADLREVARDTDTAVVVSTHDFERTPDVETIDDLLSRAATAGDAGKLAVTAADPGDVLALLVATWERTNQGDRVATMAMGESGRHSRIVAPLYGSKIGYAPVDPAEATAPGQFDLASLHSLIDQLGSPC